jgi:hypothetical protein
LEVDFGAMGARKRLHARVNGIRCGRIGIFVMYDDSTYDVEVKFLTHDPLTRAQCMP